MPLNSSSDNPDPRQQWDDDYVLVHAGGADTAAPDSRSHSVLPAEGEPASSITDHEPPPQTLGTVAATVAEVTAQKLVPALWYVACGGIALVKESISEILCVAEHAAYFPGPPFFDYA